MGLTRLAIQSYTQPRLRIASSLYEADKAVAANVGAGEGKVEDTC
jgi:hypothetical protein